MLRRLFSLIRKVLLEQFLHFLRGQSTPQANDLVNIHLLTPPTLRLFRPDTMNLWTISGVNFVSRITCLVRSMKRLRSSSLPVVVSKVASISGMVSFKRFSSVSSDTASVAKRSLDNRPLFIFS